MKKVQPSLSTMLPVFTLGAALLCSAPLMHAQSDSEHSQGVQNSQGHQQTPSEDQNAAQKTVMGTIVKSGDKLILVEASTKARYQLDDQQKAQDYINKTVKVTGVVDSSTGMIHVATIDPA